MSDLVKRLRATPLYEGSGEDSDLGEEAADRIEQLEAQLAAALGALGDIGDGEPRPKVKALVWAECSDGTLHDVDCQYELETDTQRWRVVKGVTGGGSYVCHASTLEAAKAAAQADYERRILDALEE